MLQHYKVTPIMVFDGANLPSKAGTEHDRHSSRAENKAKGMQALRSDNRSAAVEYFQKAVDVTPLMAHKCIKALRKMGVECIVAPYEADAQLAFLSIRNYVAAVITEDSDIIAFGAKVVFFKMDKEGNGEEYRQKLLGACSTMNLTGYVASLVARFLTSTRTHARTHAHTHTHTHTQVAPTARDADVHSRWLRLS